jgi:hypothetical protein
MVGKLDQTLHAGPGRVTPRPHVGTLVDALVGGGLNIGPNRFSLQREGVGVSVGKMTKWEQADVGYLTPKVRERGRSRRR